MIEMKLVYISSKRSNCSSLILIKRNALTSSTKKKIQHTKKNWKIYCFCNCLLQWLPKIAGISIKVHIRLINIIKIRLRRELPPKKNPTDAWYVLISLSLSHTPSQFTDKHFKYFFWFRVILFRNESMFIIWNMICCNWNRNLVPNRFLTQFFSFASNV